MKSKGPWLQIRMETVDSLPEVIVDGEFITYLQKLELSVDAAQTEASFDAVKFRVRHYETAKERGSETGGVSEIYKEGSVGTSRYKHK